MMAVRDKATGTLLVLGAASMSTVTMQTPWLYDEASTNTENGIGWYMNGYSWGFSPEGSLVKQWQGDEYMLTNIGASWHTTAHHYSVGFDPFDPTLPAGWFAPGSDFNNGSRGAIDIDQDKVLFTLTTREVPEAGAIGLIGFGLCGAAYVRRRRRRK